MKIQSQMSKHFLPRTLKLTFGNRLYCGPAAMNPHEKGLLEITSTQPKGPFTLLYLCQPVSLNSHRVCLHHSVAGCLQTTLAWLSSVLRKRGALPGLSAGFFSFVKVFFYVFLLSMFLSFCFPNMSHPC